MTRRERGIAAYAKIFGVPEGDLPAAFAERVGPVFAEEAIQTAGGPAWSDPALTDRERGIAIITALTAQGVTDDRLTAHVRLAQQNGLDRDALTALMILLAGYLGYAHASLAGRGLGRARREHRSGCSWRPRPGPPLLDGGLADRGW